MRISLLDARRLYEQLRALFATQAGLRGNAYLAEHGHDAAIKHHVNSFCWYAGYLPESGVFLDWGCNHGPDSCLLRSVLGERIELHACDFCSDSEFPVFRAFSRPTYRQLRHIVALPYPDDVFDVVIGSGVLEHTAMDYESLKEVHRVLKPEGIFVITYLPYFLSWSEWYRRTMRQQGFHRRRYGRQELSQLLKQTGLVPLEVRFHTFVPDRLAGGWVGRLKALASRVLSPPFRHSTLCCVARKVTCM